MRQALQNSCKRICSFFSDEIWEKCLNLKKNWLCSHQYPPLSRDLVFASWNKKMTYVVERQCQHEQAKTAGEKQVKECTAWESSRVWGTHHLVCHCWLWYLWDAERSCRTSLCLNRSLDHSAVSFQHEYSLNSLIKIFIRNPAIRQTLVFEAEASV